MLVFKVLLSPNFTYPSEESPVNAALVNAVCQEVLKALNGKRPSDNSVNMTSIQTDDEFTGNTTIATSFIASTVSYTHLTLPTKRIV